MVSCFLRHFDFYSLKTNEEQTAIITIQIFVLSIDSSSGFGSVLSLMSPQIYKYILVCVKNKISDLSLYVNREAICNAQHHCADFNYSYIYNNNIIIIIIIIIVVVVVVLRNCLTKNYFNFNILIYRFYTNIVLYNIKIIYQM